MWEDRPELEALLGSLHSLPGREGCREGGHGGEVQELCDLPAP